MELLIYFPACHQPGHPYAALVAWEPGLLSKECHDSLHSFSQRLRSPLPPNPVVVLVLDDQAQLEEVLALGALLEGLALTVILPSRDHALVDRAHLLRPRFLAYQDQDPDLLLAVLHNLLHRSWPGTVPSNFATQALPSVGKAKRQRHIA